MTVVQNSDITTVATRTTVAAGRMRRARRAQKPVSESVPPRWSSEKSKPEIRKPEMTKKTSTPTNPPGRYGTPAWAATTVRTATARSPWTSPRNAPDTLPTVSTGEAG